MKKYFLILTGFAMLTLIACNRASESYVATEATEAGGMDKQIQENFKQEENEDPTPDPQNDGAVIERKLIKTGNIRYKTDKLAAARKQLISQVAKWKGYISSEQEDNSYGTNSVIFIIRVPAIYFDTLVAGATAGVSYFDRKDIQVEDVTEQFVDIEARLKTKKLLETRYTELLQMAKSVQDVLEVEKELGNLRADIESMEGRLKYLSNQVVFSTLTISIYQEMPSTSRFGSKFAEGFANGWGNLVAFFIGLVNIWPFILLGVALLFGFKKWKKSKKNER